MLERHRKLKPYRFDQLADQINERVIPAETNVERYVGLEHLDADSLRIRRWGDPSEVESTKLRFHPNDIIFGKRRVYQRKVAVADTEGICSAHAMVLRAKPDTVLREFLPFFMQSDVFMERAISISVGSLSPTINWKTLAKEEFVLPPIQEQANLVELLHASESVSEALYGLVLATQQVLASAASETFSEICTSYPSGHLRDMCIKKPQSGIYKSEQYRGSGVPIVNMGELFDNDIINAETKMNRVELDDSELQKYRLTSNDLLFGRRSVVLEGAGRCVLVGAQVEPMVFESSILRATLDPDKVDSHFVFEWFRSPLGNQQIRRIVTFTTVSGVAGSDVGRLPIPLPPLETQQRIAGRLNKLRAKMGTPAKRIDEARNLSNAILRRVLEG